MRPRLWLIGGPNGAGKSTFVQAAPLEHVLPGVAFVNPDSIALQLLQARGFRGFAAASEGDRRTAFLDAANQVSTILDRYVEQGVAVGAETVLSSDKYKPLFAARASQFFVFDNSNEDPAIPPRMVAYGALGRVRKIDLDADPLIVAHLTAFIS